MCRYPISIASRTILAAAAPSIRHVPTPSFGMAPPFDSVKLSCSIIVPTFNFTESKVVPEAWGFRRGGSVLLHGREIILVGDLLHPGHRRSVHRLLDRDVRHAVVRGGAVP